MPEADAHSLSRYLAPSVPGLARVFRFVESQSAVTILLCSVLSIVVLGILDYRTGPEFTFSIFYLLPVAVSACSLSLRSTALIIALSVTIWLVADTLTGPDYSSLWILVWNTMTRFAVFFAFALLLSHLRVALTDAHMLAHTDYLTGVANARYFTSLATTELARARRVGAPLTIVYLDVDNFKQINDSMGHAVGDQVLRSIGIVLRDNVRASDIVARMGGDEFVILLPKTGSQSAQRLLNSLTSRAARAMEAVGHPVTFSIGAITFVEIPSSVEEMVGAADRLSYSVKVGGKNAARHVVQERADDERSAMSITNASATDG